MIEKQLLLTGLLLAALPASAFQQLPLAGEAMFYHPDEDPRHDHYAQHMQGELAEALWQQLPAMDAVHCLGMNIAQRGAGPLRCLRKPDGQLDCYLGLHLPSGEPRQAFACPG